MERRRVERLLAGDYNGAEVEPPLHDRATWRGLAEQMRREAGRLKYLSHPEFYALALNIPVLDRVPAVLSGECTDGQRICFEPNADPRVEGLNIGHGLSHVISARWQSDHNETDSWHVTGEIFLPARLALTVQSPAMAGRLQRAAPLWFLEAQIAGALAEYWRAA